MLRALLAERFKLAVHVESRQENVTAVVVAEGGPRLKESPSEQQPDGEPASPIKADFSKSKAAATDSSAKLFALGTSGDEGAS